MAPYGVTVTIGFPWRGQTEESSSVFHYDFPTLPLQAEFDATPGVIAALMKPVFDSGVSFLRGRVWGPTDGAPEDSITRAIVDIGGVGGRTTGTYIPKELAVVTSLYVGRNPATGRKRFLRKYWHPCRLSSNAAGDPALGNTALPSDTLNDFNNLYNSLKNITVQGTPLQICTPQGDHLPINTPSVCLPHLHTRQLHQ